MLDGGERRERRGECDQSCHVLAMVENCGDGRTGARGRERGSFELCGALEGGRGGSSPSSSQPFGVWSGGVGGRATGQMRGGGKLQACLGGGATHLYSPRSDRRDCSCSKPVPGGRSNRQDNQNLFLPLCREMEVFERFGAASLLVGRQSSDQWPTVMAIVCPIGASDLIQPSQFSRLEKPLRIRWV